MKYLKQNITKTISLFLIFIIHISIYGYVNIIDEFNNAKEPTAILQNCKNWLIKNYDSQDYYNVLLYYYSIEDNSNVLLSVLQNSLIHLTETQQGAILLKIAQIQELMVQINNAQTNYHKASTMLEKSEQNNAFWNSARLLYELGYFEDALNELTFINIPKDDLILFEKTTILKGILFLQLGKIAEAEKTLTNFTVAYTEIVEYLQFNLNNNRNESLIKQFFKILKVDYTLNSSKINFLQNVKVKSQNKPSFFINSIPLPPLLEKPAAVVVEKIYIQTGSFTMKENAEYMVLDLKKFGYPAFISQKNINNQNHFVAIVQMPSHYVDFEIFMKELHANGFDGFKVQLPNSPNNPIE